MKMSISDMDKLTPKTFLRIASRIAETVNGNTTEKEKATASNIMSVVRE